MIDNAKWYLGGYSTNNVVTKDMYNYERGTTVYSSSKYPREKSWIGKVGLMYPSDYGYATSGGSEANRQSCVNSINISVLVNNQNCKLNSWIHENYAQWTLSPRSSNSKYIFCATQANNVATYNAYFDQVIRPVVYLKSSIQITGGNGSANSPYVLGM